MGRGDVGAEAVADHHGVGRRHAGDAGGRLEQPRLGLADDDREPSRRHFEGGHDRAGPRKELPIGARVDRIAIGGHEQGARADRVRGDPQAAVGEAAIDPDDHGLGPLSEAV